MTLTKTPICDFGKKADFFELKSTDNKIINLNDARGEKGVLIMFICNHCPYVKAVIEDIVIDCNNLEKKGIKSVAICSNDVQNYPEDSFDKMKEFSNNHKFNFPYLVDETQEVAKKYDAPIIIMHMQGNPQDMQINPKYNDIIDEICQFFHERVEQAIELGINPNQIILDPGIGFGKSISDNDKIIHNLENINSLGFPILIGTSRKSFLAYDDLPNERIANSIASMTIGIINGANILRVHDVEDSIKVKAFLKRFIEQRLAMLSGSVGIIRVGADSKVELKEKKDRVEDAIYVTKAALREGIVPGGGIALLNASQCITPDNVGEKILLKAIKSPFETILSNAGVTCNIKMKEGEGIDVVTGNFVNMIESGIIDPVLVTKTALKNAVSVISTIISADCVISNIRLDESS